MEDESFLDCCDNSHLRFIKAILWSSHDDESLHQCENCGKYWFYRFSEYLSFEGEDDITVWYSPLTADEGRMIIESEDRSDLSFLRSRASFRTGSTP